MLRAEEVGAPHRRERLFILAGLAKRLGRGGTMGVAESLPGWFGGGCLKIQHRIATEKFLYHQQSAIGATSLGGQSR